VLDDDEPVVLDVLEDALLDDVPEEPTLPEVELELEAEPLEPDELEVLVVLLVEVVVELVVSPPSGLLPPEEQAARLSAANASDTNRRCMRRMLAEAGAGGLPRHL